MSLRDDLDFLQVFAEEYGSPEEWDLVDRLRAALTPAAIKWLEALPELLELEGEMTPRNWSYSKHGPHWNNRDLEEIEINHGPDGECVCHTVYQESDAKGICALRNALHEAALLHNAQDNKEQK